VLKAFRVILVILSLAVVFGCDRYISSRDPVRFLPDAIPVPINLTVQVGNGSVTINWEIVDSTKVALFRIYVADSTQAVYVLRDSTADYSITMEGLFVNQRYFFKVAAVSNEGLESEWSQAVSSRIMYLSITIQNDQEYTKTRDVSIQINSSPETSHLMLSEDSTFADAVFTSLVGTQTNFTLSMGDGIKTVYARLQFDGGVQSGQLLSDDIILDSWAQIDSVFFAPPGDTFTSGDTITFALVSGEPGGVASVSFTGVSKVSLFDDGTNGDLFAGDGVYSGYWVVPINFTLNDGEVTGSFTDAAGNWAAQITSQQVLNINSAPEAVELFVVIQTDTVKFTWTTSNDQDFASYRLYKDSAQDVDTSDELIAIETGQATVTYDYERPLDTAYFRIFVFDGHGLYAGSNTVKVAPGL